MRYPLTILTLTLLCLAAHAQDCIDFATLTDWRSLASAGTLPHDNDLAVSGHLVCVAAESDGLFVFDTSSGATEFAAAVTFADPVSCVVLAGTRAYAMHGDILTVIDLADPTAPALRGTVSLPDHCEYGAEVAGYVYTFDGDRLAVVDVSDPDAPYAIHTGPASEYGSARFFPRSYAYGFARVGDHLLRSWTGSVTIQMGPDWWETFPVACLDVFDVSDPDAPIWTGTPILEQFANCEGLQAVGDRAYLVKTGDIVTLDCSDPTAPVEIAVCDVSTETFHDLTLSGGVLYATTGNRLALLDFLPDGTVDPVGFVPSPVSQLSHCGTGPGHVMVLAGYGTVVQFGLGSGPLDASVTTLGENALPGEEGIQRHCLAGDVGVAIENDGDVIFLDYAAAGGPVVTATLTMPTTPMVVAINETTTVVALMPVDIMSVEIVVIDHRDLAAPVIAAVLEPAVIPYPLIISGVMNGSMAYLDVTSNGLLPIDVSDPYAPVMGSFFPSIQSNFTLVDGRLYQSSQDVFSVYDLADPFAPALMGSLPVAGSGWPHVSGTTAYVAGLFTDDDWPGYSLLTVDVSDPAAMVRLGSDAIGGSCNGMHQSGDLLYLGCLSSLQVMDISDPAVPLRVGGLAGEAGQVFGHGEALYANNTNQLWRVPPHCGDVTAVDPPGEADTPPAPVGITLAVAPNPFNPRLTASFTLDRGQAVNFAVYDLRGRRVSALAAGRLAAGEHRVTWDGRDDTGKAVPSGSYLLKLAGASRVITRKVTLVR